MLWTALNVIRQDIYFIFLDHLCLNRLALPTAHVIFSALQSDEAKLGLCRYLIAAFFWDAVMSFNDFFSKKPRATSNPESCSDIECWRAVIAGGKAREWGCTQLYLRYADLLVRKFSRLQLSGLAVEDLVHDVFVKIIKNCHAYREDRPFREWLLTIAQTTLVDHLRKTGQVQAANDANDDGQEWPGMGAGQQSEVQSGNAALQNCVQQSLVAFSEQYPDHAKVIKLAAFEGYCNKELARIIGKEVGNAREYLSQCRKKFKPFLGRCHIYLQEEVA